MPEPFVSLVPVYGDGNGVRYTVPAAGQSTVDVPLAVALHADIRPLGLADRLLRTAATGRSGDYPGLDDPEPVEPYRTRAGSVVIRDGRMLFIRCPPREDRPHYEIPGGGIEPAEDRIAALYRELNEETGLTGVSARHIATVYRSYVTDRLWLDHYYLVEAEGEVAYERLDLDDGEVPEWVPLDELGTLPAWPRRLCWRIAYWAANGWPEQPAVLSDCQHDVHLPGEW